jgi:benzoyl-CoA reductase/2-hydroxyglutaryl-CoA dehydratase subunit BcrC/BadD/HgdB
LGKGSEKVLRLIEQAGAVVVCMENCTGIKGIYQLVDENDPDPLMAIARAYLQTPCACMTPNKARVELIGRLATEYGADAVVDLSWQCCHPYHIESASLRKMVEDSLHLPFLNIATDYSGSDTGQLRTRIEAFIELIQP